MGVISKNDKYFFPEETPIIYDPFGIVLKKSLVRLKGSSLYRTIYGYYRDNWIALSNNELYIYLSKNLSEKHKDLYILNQGVDIFMKPYCPEDHVYRIEIKL